MKEISRIKLPNGQVNNIKDELVRSQLEKLLGKPNVEKLSPPVEITQYNPKESL